MIILVLNCGSSSLKYQLLDMKDQEVYDLLAKGLVERIGMEVGCLKHQAEGKEKVVREMPIPDHTIGIKAVIDALLDKETGVLTTLEDIEAVGHRVVHGAEEFVCSQLITDKVVEQLSEFADVIVDDDKSQVSAYCSQRHPPTAASDNRRYPLP